MSFRRSVFISLLPLCLAVSVFQVQAQDGAAGRMNGLLGFGAGSGQASEQGAAPSGTGGTRGLQMAPQIQAVPSVDSGRVLRQQQIDTSGDLTKAKGSERPTFERSAQDPVPSEPNEFEALVSLSTGKKISMFGSRLFNGEPSSFAPVDNIPVTADYVIGPGDEIFVRIWGSVEADLRTVVDRTGTINIPKVGVFNVAGVKYQDLPAHLKSAVGRVFRDFDLSVTLGQLRSIQVFVVGEAKRPGRYTVSSLSTLVNAVFTVGGPSAKGSLRRIQLRRQDKVITEYDMYDLLIHGDKSRDVPLLPGDVIYFPPIGPLVAVNGSVNRSNIFELKSSSARLAEVLDLAGGLATTAQDKKVTVERIENRKNRRVAEFSLDEAGRSRELRDGDVVTVYAVFSHFENAVTLRGFGVNKLLLPWSDSLRVSDLIPDRSMLVSPQFWMRHQGSYGNQLESQEDIRSEIKTLEEVNWDYASIERMQEDLSVTLIPINLAKAINDRDPQHNLLLRPGDTVNIFSKKDVQPAISKQTRYIKLEGELVTPGVYKAEPGETLRQLIVRVGGVTPAAYLYGAEFTRESTRLQQQARLEQAVNQLELELERAAADKQGTAADAQSAQVIQQAIVGQRTLIARMRETKMNGRVTLEVPVGQPTMKDLPNIELEDGDRLYIPSRPAMVSVFGSVYGPGSFIYKPGKRVSDYLEQAGGVTRDGDNGRVYVMRADGSVRGSAAGWFMGMGGETLMPGDAIVIPPNFDRFALTRELKDWTQIIYQFALGAAAFKTLK